MPDSFDPPTLDAARQRLAANDPRGALSIIDRLLATVPQRIVGLQGVRAEAYARLGYILLALQAATAELAANPDNPELRRLRDQQAAKVPRGQSDPRQRTWSTALSNEALKSLEGPTNTYEHRGVPVLKNPFDLALYPRLIQQLKPATIIEVGTFMGGSAIWLADLTRTARIQSHIYSLDVIALHTLDDERVTYLHGSGRDLGAALSSQFLSDMPRPLLVIEDADHKKETTLAVLNFFHPILRSGEYIVVEDGVSAQGPRDALVDFFAAHGHEYEVDPDFCDFYGYNVTWCVNGYLRRR